MKNVKPKNNPELFFQCLTDIDYNISNCIIYDKNNIPLAAYSKVNLENKQKIIDKEIQRVEGYIKLISPHLSFKELENDSDIQNYNLMIKELGELRQSIKASMSEGKIKQLASQIQEKYFPEDAG
jgi:tRNA splicing ligase